MPCYFYITHIKLLSITSHDKNKFRKKNSPADDQEVKKKDNVNLTSFPMAEVNVFPVINLYTHI